MQVMHDGLSIEDRNTLDSISAGFERLSISNPPLAYNIVSSITSLMNEFVKPAASQISISLMLLIFIGVVVCSKYLWIPRQVAIFNSPRKCKCKLLYQKNIPIFHPLEHKALPLLRFSQVFCRGKSRISRTNNVIITGFSVTLCYFVVA